MIKQIMPKTVKKLRKRFPHLKIDILRGKPGSVAAGEYEIVVEFRLCYLKMFAKKPTYQHLEFTTQMAAFDMVEKIKEEVQ